MSSIYISLVKAIARAIRPHQAGDSVPTAHSPKDFQAFMSKIKTNSGRFKR
ncbi:hypothetical protein SAMN04487996_111153 [Dyadobacter soli]|uniref:Uncharacterized protein n=1 Tax=Dyadobacter soli TaxID=659014 RepID=A0A1G7M3Z4_9BACT|nr:hypothetical protein [Dyadobacter soli]SDF56364.1 hypothetical protein SAMN04487996_111153 [Dyadobacter soli]